MPFVNSVFLSATFKDLKDERRAAIEEIQNLGFVIFSMEMFGADYRDKQDYIKKLIGEADFILLIIGGKYGNYLYPDQKLSFTEWEYDVAKCYGKKILPFIPANLGHIPSDKTDNDNEKRERLQIFINKVRKFESPSRYEYGDINALKRNISDSLHKYGYKDEKLSRYCGVWISNIHKYDHEPWKFGAKSDKWIFYGRGDHVYGNIERLEPRKDSRTWSFVGLEFGDQLLISFAENDHTRKSAGIAILCKAKCVDEQLDGFYYEFAKIDTSEKPIAIPIGLHRKSLDWHD